MLPNLRRAQTGNIPGYICWSCRHDLSARKTQKPRWSSTSPAELQDGEDWASNFKDLGGSLLPTIPTHNQKKEQEKGTLPAERNRLTRRQRMSSTKRSPVKQQHEQNRQSRLPFRTVASQRAEIVRIVAIERTPITWTSDLAHQSRRNTINETRSANDKVDANAPTEPQFTTETLLPKYAASHNSHLRSVNVPESVLRQISTRRRARLRGQAAQPEAQPRRVSLAKMVEEAKSRPKWGGAPWPGHDSGRALSFDTLQAGDKVSKRPIVQTKYNSRPWGLASSKRDTQASGSPAELARFQSLQSQENQANAGESDSAVKVWKRFLKSYQPPVSIVMGEGSQQSAESTAKPHPNNQPRTGPANEIGAEKVDYDDNNALDSLAKLHPVQSLSDTAVLSKPTPNDEATSSRRDAPHMESAEPRNEVASEQGELKKTRVSRKAPAKAADKPKRARKAPSAQKGADRSAAAKPKDEKKKQSKGEAKDEVKDAVKVEVKGKEQDEGHESLWEVMGGRGLEQEDLAELSKAAKKKSKSKTQDSSSVLDGIPGSLETHNPTAIEPKNLQLQPLDIPQPPVPGLSYELDRVLFNPGVYQLQDPVSRVFNFDPYLQKIMPVVEFDFNALKEYKTSSQDTALASIASEYDKRYIGSTSSMTGTLAHFHYLLSNWRPLNLDMLSRGFSDKADQVTNINKAPNAIFLRWKDGTYAIDADKEYDSPNVLMMLGKSMEKLLTLPHDEFERYRKSDPREVSEEERNSAEAYHYTTQGNFLMRSQLDAYDARLPGTGMFDLKTRAVLTVRMSTEDYEPMTGYEIQTLHGRFESYEREYYDMIRATMLKYSLQARMGRMEGIFAAYHNVERIFGFQYIPIRDMDRALHGQVDTCLGDQEFKVSLELLNQVFDKATAKFPEQTLRFHFETSTGSSDAETSDTVMWIFAEPMEESEVDRIQSSSKEKVAAFERTMMGIENEPKSSVEASEEKVDPHATAPSEPDAENGESDSIAAPAPDESPSPSPPEPDPTYITSTSNADDRFLQTVKSHDTTSNRRLFAASLICRSSVNNEPVERPERLNPTDTWKVSYRLHEVGEDADASAVWGRYEATKFRRQTALQTASAKEEMFGLSESTRKHRDTFMQFLREMSQKGRTFRGGLDQLEDGREQVVVGRPVTAAATAAAAAATAGDQAEGTHEARELDVEGYMAWMYGHTVDQGGQK